MSESSDKGVQKVTPSSVPAAPEFINRGQEAAGRERLAEFVRPPLLKIVQKQSDDALVDAFGKGATLITPANVLVAKPGQSFFIVPLIQYAEYITWAPIALKGQVPAILERSTDPLSALASKARNKDKWSEYGYRWEDRVIGDKNIDGPGGQPVRHVEHITFLVVVISQDLGMVPCIMSFAKGGHKFGRNFASLLQMRNADIYGCVFEVVVPEEPQKNESGSWYVWDVKNPTEGSGFTPWVTDRELYEALKAEALKLEDAYRNNLLRADYDEPSDSTTSASPREDM